MSRQGQLFITREEIFLGNYKATIPCNTIFEVLEDLEEKEELVIAPVQIKEYIKMTIPEDEFLHCFRPVKEGE